uniref:E3 ubiquitin-protein ligase TRIM7-like n=1 Tax=Euleptes europaea TaxID=460621 RepID=UPI002540D5FF|nr:E3 ubiquitin-protein ligase TRIM7-like [Euleptes europaea]
MAAGDPVNELCEEATCSICLEYFSDPMTVAECGHNFCRSCLTQCWGKAAAEASCPQCRGKAQTGNLRPNRQLANVVEIVKRISLQGGNGEKVKERVCKKHQERLKLFCQNDEILICVVCDRSKEHKDHEVIPAEEASGEYKDKFCSCLKTLKKKRKKILASKADIEKGSQELLEQTQTEKGEIVTECRQLCQFLEEQERLLLAKVEEVEKEIARERDEHLARLSVELSSLESLIQEMEEKIHQPVTELLQDVGSTLQRCEEKEKEKFEDPVAFPPALKWKIWDIWDLNVLLKGATKQFKDALVLGLQPHKANVTLDPDTAHPKLMLSEDRKSMTLEEKAQALPNNPERFDNHHAVLGREGFTGGRHFWEVIVENEDDWDVGVAKRSVKRKGRIPFTWSIGKAGKFYYILGDNWPVHLCSEPRRIRVSLNYAGGQVSFFDADKATLLFMLSDVSFSGDTPHPYFAVHDKGYLRLSP